MSSPVLVSPRSSVDLDRGAHAPLARPPVDDAADRLLKLAIVAGVLASALLLVFDEVALAAGLWSRAALPPVLATVLFAWAALATVRLALQTALWLRYRPTPRLAPHEAPPLTVVIPAYNEGAMVARSIESVARARYPRERLEVFVVDDGSSDDTWEHIERAAARFPGLVTTLRFAQNRGKREALAAGFRRARGEVLVTIDSDSEIEPDTLLELAAPLRDPRVGAVAGRVAVHNRQAGIIPRMLHVVFTLSFDFHRATQSVYGTVYCCPGALTAYRASAVRQVLDAWLGQRFLGAPCAAGEDRALTNDTLALGFDAVYQREAVVHTLVPTDHRQLCRMLLRWDRSYVREELRFLRVVWSRPPRARALALFETIVRNVGLPVRYLALAVAALLVLADPALALPVVAATAVGAGFRMLYYLRSERSTSFVYGLLYPFYFVFGLSWIFPYAVLTVRARGWLTR